jgi:hypothetical protein
LQPTGTDFSETGLTQSPGIPPKSSELKVIQINLQHKKAASLHLIQELEQGGHDVALIQEPYLNKTNKIVGLDKKI